ncbi:MAG: ABC transporter ATP-binding protein [Candidatus Omnitrophica bacterium]|nr:ABC transporter ATP-binding protein [Candidatus Omnitrophota bacterium]
MLCELKNAKKHFSLGSPFWGASKEIVKAVDGVDLSLMPGETFSVVGESGSGKSTLARLVCDLYRADGGEVLFEGSNIRGMDKNQYRAYRRSVQMVFQDPFSSLDPRFTVEKILKEAFTLETKVDGEEKLERIRETLKAVELPHDILLRYPHEFSGGERQRLSIARAVLSRPKLVILDEAVSSLDVLVQGQILDLLSSLKKRFGLTYLFISHNLRVVAKISDKIAVMYKGKIVETGPAPKLVSHPVHPYTRELWSAAVEYVPRHENRSWSLPADGRGKFFTKDHWAMDTVN